MPERAHWPPYVTRKIVYAINSYECGHMGEPAEAYEEVAREMIAGAEYAGARPRFDADAATDAEYEALFQLEKRLAQWLTWVDRRLGYDPDEASNE